MTIIAGRGVAMAGFHPSVKLFLHDMAVGTGVRVVGQIGIAFGINKGIRAEPCCQSKNDADHNQLGFGESG